MADWAQVEAIFLEALERAEGAEREAYLKLACAGDGELRAEVESLLATEGKGERLFPALVENLAGSLDDGAEEAGSRLGPYRIRRTLGEGGMGTVYLAYRDDDEYRKQVAIKVVRVPGRLAMGRFRHERQILATLEHPNIARLIDGATSDRGMPYLVMEYVEGKNLTEYCDEQQTSLRGRLRLFLKICAAVQYAHRFLIVHRDLKPANILVTAQGEPKLLDFGIAKLLDPGQVQMTAFETQTGLHLLTPEYAAPEQVRGDPVTTATDIYALGVVLYELLTGRRAQPVASTAPREVMHAVCEREPDAPGLGSDLDNILRMALRKEPERRYSSVEQFAADIQRFLDDRPVQARPDTLRYRVGKFARRNRWAVGSAMVVAALLVAGVATITWQARRAQRRFEQVRHLANRFLFDFDKEIQNLAGTTKARQLLVATALEYLDSLGQEAGDDATLLAEIAEAYEKVGEVQGWYVGPNLGRTGDALNSWRKATEIRERLAARDGSQNEPLGYLLARRGYLERVSGQTEAALASLRRAVKLLDASGKPGVQRARAHCFLSDLQVELANADEALPEARICLEQLRELKHPRLGSAIGRVAIALREAGQVEEAARMHREGVAVLEAALAAKPEDAGIKRELSASLVITGDVHAHEYFPNLGDKATAGTYYRRALALSSELRRADPSDANLERDTNIQGLSVALAAGWEGRAREAVPGARKLVAQMDEHCRRDPKNTGLLDMAGMGHQSLAFLLERAGLMEEAGWEAAEAARLQEGVLALDPTNRGSSFSAVLARVTQARLLRTAGDANGALSVLLPVAARAEALERETTSMSTWNCAALYYGERGRAERKAAWLERAIAVWRKMRDRGVAASYYQARLEAAEADLAALGR